MEMADTLECSYTNINNFLHHGASSKCEFAMKYCGEENNYINTITLYYCNLDEHMIPMVLIAIPWLLLCFYWLSSTSERYLEPSLSRVAKIFRLSESLAGVTIIAFANGAPDLISAYVASQSRQKEGINLAFGALFGASVFTTSIILARVIYNAKSLQLSARTLIRDCGFYILADIYIFYLGTLQQITLGHVLVLFISYTLYVALVIGKEIMDRRSGTLKPVDFETPTLPKKKAKELIENVKQPVSPAKPQFAIEPAMGSPSGATVPSCSEIPSSQTELKIGIEDSKDDVDITNREKIQVAINRSLNMVFNGWKVVETPLNWIRDITIPKVIRPPVNRTRIVLYPFFCSLFIVWEFEILAEYGTNPIFWVIFTSSTGISGALFWIISRNQRGQKVLSGLFMLAGAIMAVLWVRLVADLLIDLLVVIKVASGLPMNLIGLTVLAWGNSANDFFVDVALAKNGFGIMAASGIFSGQYFNMQIGFGMLLLLEGGGAKLSLFNGTTGSKINYVLVICSLVSLIGTLGYGTFRKFTLDKKYAQFLFAFYIVFCCVICGIVMFF